MVLMLWINGYRHTFGTDGGFDLVVGGGCRQRHTGTQRSRGRRASDPAVAGAFTGKVDWGCCCASPVASLTG